MKKITLIIVIVVILILGVAGYFIINSNQETLNEKVNNESVENDSNNLFDVEEDINDDNALEEEEVDAMIIRVSDGSNAIMFELNTSIAARDLYNQLPLTVEVENFSSNEKIFYPSADLNVEDTPRSSGGGAGILAYYEPWGDVVMFYDSFSSASGLYELGIAKEGTDQISSLSGEIIIEKLES